MTISEQINHSVLGILLAGGDSSRFGKRNKLFVEIKGRSIIEISAQNLIDSGVESVKVVTGYQADLVEKELAHLDIEFLYNGDWRVGQSTSVRRGLRAVSKEEAVMEFTPDPEAALSAVREGVCGVAFLLNPTPIEAVTQIARAGGRMPQKSTYFYPQLGTGLVLNPLD